MDGQPKEATGSNYAVTLESTSCGAAVIGKPKASLRALGCVPENIAGAAKRATESIEPVAAPQLQKICVLLPRARRLAQGLLMTAAPRLVSVRTKGDL